MSAMRDLSSFIWNRCGKVSVKPRIAPQQEGWSPVAPVRSCPFRGRVWPSAPASALNEAGPPEKSRTKDMSGPLNYKKTTEKNKKNACCSFASPHAKCGTWSLLRVMRSFSSSTPLLSSSSSISSVLILSWKINRQKHNFYPSAKPTFGIKMCYRNC